MAVLRLFLEADDAVILVDLDHAEAAGLLGGDLDGRDGHVGAVLAMPFDHQVVIHLVDVITGQDQAVLGRLGDDRLDVLEDRRPWCPDTSPRVPASSAG